jgi:heterodisulfide reductase subunit A2
LVECKIGVYICHCGSNIAGIVDVASVAEYARTLPNVTVARDYKYMCSDPGQNIIKEDIKTLGLNRVVVASCSPRMHEPTFRRLCQSSGLNQYLFEMANIREHCSWVHTDKAMATEKAKALVSAAVRRVFYQEPLETKEVSVNPNTLVIGGGVAGIQAALEIADAGKKVYLLEKDASIGGHMAMFDKTFPTLDCAACILTPKMTTVGQHRNINLLAFSELAEVSGYIGNFKARIKKKARYIDSSKCTGCGRCSELCPTSVPNEFDCGLSKRKAIYIPSPYAVPNKAIIDAKNCLHIKGMEKGKDVCRLCQKGNEKKGQAGCEAGAIDFKQKDEVVEIEIGNIIVATGFQQFDPSKIYQYGYGRYDNVITGLEFERLTNSSGPTGGKVLLKDGTEPKSIAILHCIGSRDANYHKYCSRVCCMYSLKFAHLLREKLPEARVYQLYIDMRCAGSGYEEFYERLQAEGVEFMRGKAAEIINYAQALEEKGKLVVMVEDTLVRHKRRLAVDMAVMSCALEPRADTEQLARILALSRKADGFFLEKHPKLDPVATTTDGIYVVGCCQSPKDIPDTVAQASAAAARALAIISKGKVEIEAAIAHIDEEHCAGCKICIGMCPYKAISFDDVKKVSRVNEALCKGCGTCVAACPSGAIKGRHFTTEEIMAEIEGVLS